MNHYTLYGLHIVSEFALGGLLTDPTPEDAPDVIIRTGETPTQLEGGIQGGVLYQIAARDFLLDVEGAARYHVHDGQTITVQPNAGADDESVRLFLLGSALGALLHQRGMLPLHASAIETENGAALFTGVSGAGKSTTAAALNRRGYALIADDIAVIYAGSGGIPMVAPAFPQMKLWAQSLRKLETAADGLTRVRPQLEKYALPIADAERFRQEPLAVRSIYLLTTNHEGILALKAITGMNKLRALRNQVYRRRMMEQMGADTAHFAAITALANGARLIHVRRPDHPFMLDELVALLEEDFAQ